MDALEATVTDAGDMLCPKCGTLIITPMGNNPSHGWALEKYCLIPGPSYHCQICDCDFVVSVATAKKHNHFWFPEIEEFK